MRRIGGEPRRALQFFLLGNKRGFDAFSARAIFFRIDRQFRDRRGQSFRNQVTGNEPTQQQDRARPENLPTQPLLPGERALQWINRNLVGGGERRTGIQPFEKEKMRVAVDLDPRTALGLVRDEETRHFLVHDRASASRKRRQMEPAVEPDAALHFFRAAFLCHLERLEPDDERGNHLVGLGRGNRQRDNFVDRFRAGARAAKQVTDLRRLRQDLKRELLFFLRPQRPDVHRIWRQQDRAGRIEEAIKSRVWNAGDFIRLRIFFVLHDVAQFVLRARIKQVERVVFAGGVKARFRHEGAATLRERGVTNFFDVMQPGKGGLEIALQILLQRAGRVALRDVKAGGGESHHDEHHRDQKFRAKTRRWRFFFVAQTITENRPGESSRY